MGKATLTFLLFIISHSLVAQGLIISGKVTNAETGMPIPYANIGIAGKAIGTVATASGNFSFTVKVGQLASTDQLVASCVGYESTAIAFDTGEMESLQFSLKPQVVEIGEIKVIAGKLRKKALGKDDREYFTHYNFYTVHDTAAHDRLGREVGNIINLNKACYLNDFNVYFQESDFASVKFRFNVYEVVDGLPGKSLLQEDIIFEAKGKSPGWVQVSLKEFDILVKGHDKVAVTVQWLESVEQKENSKFMSVPIAVSPVHTIVRRDKSAEGWKKSGGYLSMYLNADCYKP